MEAAMVVIVMESILLAARRIIHWEDAST